MIWLTWRQFRAQARTALVILAAAAICFLVTGLQIHHAYTADLATCTPQHDCSDVLSQLAQGYNAAFNLTEILVIAVPGLIGIFWGAPLSASIGTAAVLSYLLPSTTVTFPVDKTTASQATGIYTRGGGSEIFIAGLPVPLGAWVLSAACSHLHCFAGTSGPLTKGGLDVDKTAACLAAYNLHESVTYQPARYYWPLQWYETGIFLALAGVLSGTSFWWIRRRRN